MCGFDCLSTLTLVELCVLTVLQHIRRVACAVCVISALFCCWCVFNTAASMYVCVCSIMHPCVQPASSSTARSTDGTPAESLDKLSVCPEVQTIELQHAITSHFHGGWFANFKGEVARLERQQAGVCCCSSARHCRRGGGVRFGVCRRHSLFRATCDRDWTASLVCPQQSRSTLQHKGCTGLCCLALCVWSVPCHLIIGWTCGPLLSVGCLCTSVVEVASQLSWLQCFVLCTPKCWLLSMEKVAKGHH